MLDRRYLGVLESERQGEKVSIWKVYYDNRGAPTTLEVVAENREEAIRETKQRLGYRAEFEIEEVEK